MRAAIQQRIRGVATRSVSCGMPPALTRARMFSHTHPHAATHTHARRVAARLASSLTAPAPASPGTHAPPRSPAALLPPVEHPAFTVSHHAAIPELSVRATLYTHTRTRGEVLSIVSEDEEKVFGVCFRTPPSDDSGVPHVLEHSVLCGSRKYPLKEPFVALLRSSLHTYLNAFTYPDRTVYPVASPNTQDFYNLVDVYLDAVFHPRLQPWVLQQEGWHYEVEHTPAGARRLAYKGVVFNEMKGVYSSADSVRSYAEERALFAHHQYARSSGGDPLAIPSLTFEAFTAFHSQFYHPSNARTFFFGDDDPRRRLEIVDAYYSGFQAAPEAVRASTISYQPLLPAPRRVLVPVPAEGEEGVGSEPAALDEADAAAEESSADMPEPLSPAGVAARIASVEEHAALAGAQLGGAHVLTPPAVGAGMEDEVLVDFSVGAAGAISVRSVAGVPAIVREDAPTTVPAAARQGALARKHAVSVNWVLNDAELDELTRMGLGVLSQLLMQTQVATLYKALTDSALGSAVIGGGVDTSMIHATFSAGLKGVHADSADEVELLVLRTLEAAARDGFTKEHLDAAFNTIEFALREFAGGGGPRGLSLCLSAIPGWIYGRNPVDELHFEAPLQRLKAAVAADAEFFQRLIRRYLLENQHRITVHAYPDPMFNARREGVERQALDAKAATMSEEEWKRVADTAEELKRRQATPDSPEAVASIPTLKLADLPRTSKALPKEVVYLRSLSTDHHVAARAPDSGDAPTLRSAAFRGLLSAVEAVRRVLPPAYREVAPTSNGAAHEAVVEVKPALEHHNIVVPTPNAAGTGVEFLQHALPTNGIAYTAAYFDLSPLPQRLLPYVPLFAWASTSCGTLHTDEVAMSHALGTHTGGVGIAASVTDVPGSRAHAFPYLVLGGKALLPSVERMSELGTELLLSARLSRKERVAHYLRSSIARHEAGIVSSGHRYAGAVLSSLYTKAGWINEALGGLSQLYAARQMLHRLETGSHGGFDGIVADLLEIRHHVLRRDNVLLSATADAAGMPSIERAFGRLLDALGENVPPAKETSAFRLMGVGTGLPRLATGWQQHDRVVGSSDERGAHEREFACEPIPGKLYKNATQPGYVGLVVPTQVNYVAKAAPAYAPGTIAPGSAEVLTNLLRTGYLWERVRVQGGAYGGFCGLNRHAGLLSYGSYRDPNVAATLDAFDAVGAHLRSTTVDKERARLEDDVQKAIISTVGGLDAPMSPEEKGERSTARHLAGITDAHVQHRRDEIMATNVDDVLAFASAADTVAREGHVVVVASEEAFAQYHRDTSKPMFELLHPLQASST